MIATLSIASSHQETWFYYINQLLRLFHGKLKSKWVGPFKVTHAFYHGAIELEKKIDMRFKVNGQRIKPYFGNAEKVQTVEAWTFSEV